jgi:hypothetical protein
MELSKQAAGISARFATRSSLADAADRLTLADADKRFIVCSLRSLLLYSLAA